ncbi:prolipoprotein diacylglyceryl transferase [Acetobacterium carbinolicum]|jgi:phosphatidylglycerol:prolipoprotein diacylglycerol transferase|uniref:prolipoprotein diacylglyceryl transferase n=1 Tax=Acetobacterium TaxID=33951 RepID=UPI0029E2CEA4|nr:phosphatidylglycerol---prolipoprotein diacylglyceryl transferase [Acetobacterium sp.]
MMNAPNPIAFTAFGLEVRWYGVLIAAALLIGLLIALKRAPKYGIDPEIIMDFFLYMTPAVIIGARLYYVIFSYDYYAAHPEEIFAIWNGGLAIHGGIIAGVIVALVLCRVKKISFFALADVLIPALPLGQAIGRWGNYFNQEAYGSQTDLPWAITVNDAALGIIKVHPTFLYESIWNLLAFGFIFFYEDKIKKVDGELLFVYLGLYSVGRFFIEGLRTDSLMFMGLRIAQLISLVLVAVGVAGLWYLRKNEDQFANSLSRK